VRPDDIGLAPIQYLLSGYESGHFWPNLSVGIRLISALTCSFDPPIPLATIAPYPPRPNDEFHVTDFGREEEMAGLGSAELRNAVRLARDGSGTVSNCADMPREECDSFSQFC